MRVQCSQCGLRTCLWEVLAKYERWSETNLHITHIISTDMFITVFVILVTGFKTDGRYIQQASYLFNHTLWSKNSQNSALIEPPHISSFNKTRTKNQLLVSSKSENFTNLRKASKSKAYSQSRRTEKHTWKKNHGFETRTSASKIICRGKRTRYRERDREERLPSFDVLDWAYFSTAEELVAEHYNALLTYSRLRILQTQHQNPSKVLWWKNLTHAPSSPQSSRLNFQKKL